MSFDPTIGSWISEDPIDFQAADANVYRYVGNNPANATDPLGLWTWKIDDKGRILAIAEKDDTFDTLKQQGYDETKLKAAMTGTVVKAGVAVDLTSFFPKLITDAIVRQQTLSYEKVRSAFEKGTWTLKDKGKTIGTSGVDLTRRAEIDDKGRFVYVPCVSDLLGWGNCYGFIGLFLGRKPRDMSPAMNFTLSGLAQDEKYFHGFAPGLPNKETDTSNFIKGDGGGRVGTYHPGGGLYKYFTQGRKVTTTPTFGAIALYCYQNKIGHAAIVLGRSKAGDVYVIQKLNLHMGYALTKAKDPGVFDKYDDISYYQ